MKTLAHALVIWACFGMLIGPIAQTTAGEPAGSVRASSNEAAAPQDVTYIPSEAVAAAVVHPQTVLASPDADWLPLEVLTAWGKKEIGFDPVKIKEAVAFCTPPAAGPPQFGAVVRLKEAYSKADIVAKLRGAIEVEIDGQAVLALPFPGAPEVYFSDDHTIVIGSAALMKPIIAAKDVDSAVTRLLKEGDGSGLLTTVVSLDDLRPLIQRAMSSREARMARAQAPPAIQEFFDLPDLLTAVIFRMSGTETMTISLTLRARDGAAAEEAERIITQGLDTARQAFQAQAAHAGGANSSAVELATIKYSARMSEQMWAQIKPVREGRDIRIAVRTGSSIEPIAMIGAAVAFLLPAVNSARDAARRVQSTRNMRQIELAMLNYHSAKRRFPARAIFDDNGKPLLSWRVAILPYVEGKQLYKQFRLDEPWDSEHNKPLIAQMPRIYRNPNREVDDKTNYLLPVGPGLFGGDNGLRVTDIHDGTSKTVMLIEADESRAVIWTKPDDLDVDLDHPRAGLGGLRREGILAGFCDGSVRMLRPAISDKTLKALFTYKGGEAINSNDL